MLVALNGIGVILQIQVICILFIFLNLFVSKTSNLINCYHYTIIFEGSENEDNSCEDNHVMNEVPNIATEGILPFGTRWIKGVFTNIYKIKN